MRLENGLLETILEEDTVREPGEIIVQRLMSQGRFGPGPLRNVVDDGIEERLAVHFDLTRVDLAFPLLSRGEAVPKGKGAFLVVQNAGECLAQLFLGRRIDIAYGHLCD